MIKYLIILICCVILISCPGATQIEYKPTLQLIKKEGVYLYPLKDSQDTVRLTCFYTKIFNSKKYNENIIVIITSNKERKIPTVSSSNNGKLKLYKNKENEKIFILNDSIDFKKIKLKKDSINIKLDESNNLVFLHEK